MLAVPCIGLAAPDGRCCFLSCSSLVPTKQIEIWWSEARALLLDCQGEGQQDSKIL